MKRVNVRCSECGRFLASFDAERLDVELKCANCKSFKKYHIMRLSSLQDAD